MARDIERDYRDTTYRVLLAQARPLDLRVGDRCPGLDRWLALHAARTWAFLTAWNPGSLRQPLWCNARRQEGLLAALAGRFTVLPAIGFADAGDWSEDSLFIAPVSPAHACRLGRLFGQCAVLVGRRGSTPRLAWCCGRLTS